MGNKIPAPMLMFIVLALAVVVISGICSALGVSAVNPATGEVVEVVKLCSIDGILKMLTKAVTNFTGVLCDSETGSAIASAAPLMKGLTVLIALLFVIMCGFLNLLIGSASTKWSLLSSVFVPMFMLLGYHPALVQMAYRIGDAITNPICPTFAYFGMLLALAQKYDKKAGFGTLMSNMLPYVICYFVFMVVELLFWFFLKIPFGPGGPVLLNG